MCDLNVLQFDSVKMDTALAEHYLRDQKKYHSTADCRRGKEEKVICDSYKNNIYCIENTFVKCENEPISDLLVKMTQLADKLRTNEELFAQLDSLIRQRPIYEGKIHVDLIIKQLLYWSLDSRVKECVLTGFHGFEINISDDAQLLSLGIIAFALTHYSNINIIATKEMAVICHLFTSLCREVGLKNVYLILVEQIIEKECDSYYVDKTESNSNHCVGIITERSDLDSALDVFLASTSTSPWSLKNLFIQESIYEDFKAIMKWKCKNNLSEDSENNYNVYEYESKLFILDIFNEKKVFNKHVVKVEAYRITKELIALIEECKPDYLSLWANDIAEANEIVYGVNCKVIWVNDFGTFDGSEEVSKPIYQDGFMQYLPIKIPITMSACSKEWAKQNSNARMQRFLELLTNYESTPDLDHGVKEFIHTLKTMVGLYKSRFICEFKGTVCIGIEKPVGSLLATGESDKTYIANAVASLPCGNALIIEPTNYETYKGLFDLLIKSNVPVHVTSKVDSSEKDTITVKSYYTNNFTNMKVIYFNYGTIFAN